MSLDVMAFIVGGLLIGAGVFGGGLEVKELKIPQIAGFARATSVSVGAVFIALAVFLNAKPKESAAAPEPAQALVSEEPRNAQTFDAPTYDGIRLDACFEWGNRCGEEAATAWCRTRGFKSSTSHELENVGARKIPTKLIGTQQICREQFCTSFAHITCEK